MWLFTKNNKILIAYFNFIYFASTLDTVLKYQNSFNHVVLCSSTGSKNTRRCLYLWQGSPKLLPSWATLVVLFVPATSPVFVCWVFFFFVFCWRSVCFSFSHCWSWAFLERFQDSWGFVKVKRGRGGQSGVFVNSTLKWGFSMNTVSHMFLNSPDRNLKKLWIKVNNLNSARCLHQVHLWCGSRRHVGLWNLKPVDFLSCSICFLCDLTQRLDYKPVRSGAATERRCIWCISTDSLIVSRSLLDNPWLIWSLTYDFMSDCNILSSFFFLGRSKQNVQKAVQRHPTVDVS